ncbi:Esterase B1 [Pseudolycoriella hygida]|uniref:carboxylesterase n=1 Tax=Pseudolycoriella hygida TaxID=35572 RepID=A0A9Q0N7X5_9DIPT|nr:Esterase B1 [Pseudolycoriella hygida]
MSKFDIVETELGKVRGVKKVSVLGTSYNAFLGIPYAQAPIGELRFKNPLPPVKWENIYDATEEKTGSFGENFYTKTIIGSEDCLHINIFTKNLQPKNLQPVMMYVHGGSWLTGSNTMNSLSPDFLLMADVVIVTINYRLGALGFLSLQDESLNVPGNAAMKDQVMAMKFVQKNIRNFGGDPSNCTLFGHSAGGASVSWHCVSDMSKGLFQKAIIMSGCVLNKFAFTPQRDWANRLARKLGYTGDNEGGSVLAFLNQADPVKIVEFQDSLLLPEERGKISLPFAPHIEPYINSETFNSELPIDLVRKAWSNDIDILLGVTSDEGLMFLEYYKETPSLLKMVKLENLVPTELSVPDDSPIRMSLAEKLKKIYYPSNTNPTEDAMAYGQLRGDQTLCHGMQRIIQSRQHSGKLGKTFYYCFAVDSPTQNHYRNAHLGLGKGVCHADEVSYLFKSTYVDLPDKDSMEFIAITRFVSLFTSFATTGNPNDNVINAQLNNVEWQPVHTADPPFKSLNIDEELRFENFPLSERLKVWDWVYHETNTPLY